jgi:hypothetical protein
MTLRRLLPAALAAVVPLAACDLNENLPTQLAGGTGGGQGVPFSFPDPLGDLLPGADELVAPDLTGLSGTVGTDSLTLRLSFARPVARYSANASNSLDGVIELDMDGSAGTGDRSIIEGLGGAPGIGVDFYVLLRDDEAPDAVTLVNATTGSRTRVGATFTSTSVTVRLRRADVADADGRFRVATVVGTRAAPTDIAPAAGAFRVGE